MAWKSIPRERDLTIEFADRAKFVINRHRAARQILDGRGGARLAFRRGPDDRPVDGCQMGDELWSCLSRQIGEKLGLPLSLAAG